MNSKILNKTQLKELLAKSGVDSTKLKALRKLRENRRKLGRRRASYNLAIPFDRQRVTAGASPGDDPRLIRLQSSTPNDEESEEKRLDNA